MRVVLLHWLPRRRNIMWLLLLLRLLALLQFGIFLLQFAQQLLAALHGIGSGDPPAVHQAGSTAAAAGGGARMVDAWRRRRHVVLLLQRRDGSCCCRRGRCRGRTCCLCCC